MSDFALWVIAPWRSISIQVEGYGLEPPTAFDDNKNLLLSAGKGYGLWYRELVDKFITYGLKGRPYRVSCRVSYEAHHTLKDHIVLKMAITDWNFPSEMASTISGIYPHRSAIGIGQGADPGTELINLLD